MLLYRPSVVLHLCKLSPSSSSPIFFSQFRHSLSPSSTSLRVALLSPSRPRGEQLRAYSSGGDTFFSEEGVSWTSLGVSDKLSRALYNAGLGQPSSVQASCIPSILSGKDVVVAAETGSGKTHGYLVPLINRMCNAKHESESAESDEGASAPHRRSLVLCPNVTLCEQVARMANGLCDDDGQPLLAVSAVCGRQGWPVIRPDIIVTTPAALLNNIEPNSFRKMEFLRGVKYVVFDEADMLLSGGFENKVIRLIHMLRYDEKQLSRSKKSTPESGMNPKLETSSDLSLDMDADPEDDVDSDDEESFIEESLVDVDPVTSSRSDWRRVRKIYERSKQYVFIAATLPENGKRTTGAVLKKMFPDANWVNGSFLHRHNPRLKQKWVEVSTDTQVDELLKAVKEGTKSNSVEPSRTIVFANTVEAVEAVAKILLNSGTECYRYHKDCSLEERATTLNDFQEKGGVLVCTDAVSRGVDIPNISHVIQADFATSAVDFLHRVGRTARAGQYGVVTSFYNRSNRDLVSAVRRAGELGQSVETAFSRKRGFRNKIKKRGSGNGAETSAAVC